MTPKASVNSDVSYSQHPALLSSRHTHAIHFNQGQRVKIKLSYIYVVKGRGRNRESEKEKVKQEKSEDR